jgi:hypothetical protein
LVVDTNETYEVTERGWLFYVNLMYYLMPTEGKRWISNKIESQLQSGRECEDTALEELIPLSLENLTHHGSDSSLSISPHVSAVS